MNREIFVNTATLSTSTMYKILYKQYMVGRKRHYHKLLSVLLSRLCFYHDILSLCIRFRSFIYNIAQFDLVQSSPVQSSPV